MVYEQEFLTYAFQVRKSASVDQDISLYQAALRAHRHSGGVPLTAMASSRFLPFSSLAWYLIFRVHFSFFFRPVLHGVVEKTTICEAPLYLRHDVNHGTSWQVRDFWHCYFVTGPSGCSNKGVFEVSSASRRGICQDGTWELVNPNTITSDELYGVRVRRCFFIIGASCWSVLECM